MLGLSVNFLKELLDVFDKFLTVDNANTVIEFLKNCLAAIAAVFGA